MLDGCLGERTGRLGFGTGIKKKGRLKEELLGEQAFEERDLEKELLRKGNGDGE